MHGSLNKGCLNLDLGGMEALEWDGGGIGGDGWVDGRMDQGQQTLLGGSTEVQFFFELWETLNPCCVCAIHLIGFCRMLIYDTCWIYCMVLYRMGRTFIVVSARTVLALMFGMGRGWLVGNIACDDGAQGVVYRMSEGVMGGLGLMVYDEIVGRGLSAPQISSSVLIL